jgi:hypothetical protein
VGPKDRVERERERARDEEGEREDQDVPEVLARAVPLAFGVQIAHGDDRDRGGGQRIGREEE